MTNKPPLADLYLLKKIGDYLKASASPFARIEVGNPIYEWIKFAFSVRFTEDEPGQDGMLLTRLNEDISRYLCPWRYHTEARIDIGGKLFLSDFISFLKNLPYVRYITGLSAQHLYLDVLTSRERMDRYRLMDTARDDTKDVVKGSRPSSVFIPAPTHLIQVLKRSSQRELEPAGIGNLVVGFDLLVQDSPAQEEKSSASGLAVNPENDTYSLTFSLA